MKATVPNRIGDFTMSNPQFKLPAGSGIVFSHQGRRHAGYNR
jgi:hypothetical protein